MSEFFIPNGFDRDNTIVKNPDKFKEFKKKLKGINVDMNRSNRYNINEDIYEYIIKELKNLLIEFEIRLIETSLDRDYAKKVIEDRNYFLSIFRNSFKNNIDFIKYIDNESINYFFMQKISQLSHGYGLFHGEIAKSEEIPKDIKNYFYLFLFLDSYECFGKYLNPFFKKIWNDSGHITSKEYSSRDIYRNLGVLFENRTITLGIKNEELFRKYTFLRNDIAHSSIIVRNNKFISGYELNKKIEDYNIDEVINDIDIFLITMIIYATAFDIEMLELYFTKDSKIFNNWIKFFNKYWESWEFIGERV